MFSKVIASGEGRKFNMNVVWFYSKVIASGEGRR